MLWEKSAFLIVLYFNNWRKKLLGRLSDNMWRRLELGVNGISKEASDFLKYRLFHLIGKRNQFSWIFSIYILKIFTGMLLKDYAWDLTFLAYHILNLAGDVFYVILR